MKTLMRNGRDRRSENPFLGHAKKERVSLFGTDQRITSGPAARRPHSKAEYMTAPERFADSQIPLAPRAVAVGTEISLRPPQSGRIEARIGLRMMPTFPRPSLSFRTAGFPQYGWKAGLSGGAFPDVTQLKSAPDIRCMTAGLHPPFVHLVVAAMFPL